MRLLPKLNHQIWILAVGRFLLEFGTGFTLFYAPIFFVNKVGLSATSVGIAIGSASLSGIVGRILSGSFSDSPYMGRRRTLLLAAAVSAIGSVVLATTYDFVTLLIGNAIAGMGLGLYWPANEAVVADITLPETRHEAYALTRLSDNLGLGMGIVLGGVIVATTGNYRLLFVIDAISFIVFFVVIYFAIQETNQAPKAISQGNSHLASWLTALQDSRFRVFLAVNIIFTTYFSQLQSTLPIYFKNFVPTGALEKGFSETTISSLFAWHLSVVILGQLPVAHVLKRLSDPLALVVSTVLWASGFLLIWATPIFTSHHSVWAALALGVFALAIVSYTPSSSSLITELAPESQRGVYFAIGALCWAIGYAIGPSLGGWALDQDEIVVNYYWLGLALTAGVAIAILLYLERMGIGE
ncbi:MFS transporter [Scytonema sp. NUACC26]